MVRNVWPIKPGIIGNAEFGEDGIYRYWLRREWDKTKEVVAFVMLNPSEADDKFDDRAVLRCIDFAQQWGFGSLEIVNLFAYCSSDRTVLKKVDNPVGSKNDQAIQRAALNSDTIIVAWGNDGVLKKRDLEVLHLLREYDLYCMGLTDSKKPKYPARLASSTKYIKYRDGMPLVVAKRNDDEYLVIKHNDMYALVKNGSNVDCAKWQKSWVLASAIMKAEFEQVTPYFYGL